MPNTEEIRSSQRTAWAGLAPDWEKWDAVIQQQLGPVGDAMIESLDLTDVQHHLDVAAGTGEPGLTVARLVPHARVVLTDLSAEMLDIAARRAAAARIAGVETRVCSADDLPFEDGTFDTVSVRFGYMFFPDPAAATAELARVLRPGGRLSASVWADGAQNPWTTLALDAIAAESALPPREPDAPGMFRCAAPGYLRELFRAAGLRDVTERDVEVELVTDSADQYWQMISEHASLAVAALSRVDAATRERIAASVKARVRDHERDGKVRVPGLARCTTGTA